MEHTVYSTITGAILRLVGKPVGDGPPTLKTGEASLIGAYSPAKYKIVGESVVLKTANPATIDKSQITAETEYATVSNLTNPSRVLIIGNDEGFLYTVTDGELEFSIDTAGDYVVRCTSAIDLDVEFEMEVV